MVVPALLVYATSYAMLLWSRADRTARGPLMLLCLAFATGAATAFAVVFEDWSVGYDRGSPLVLGWVLGTCLVALAASRDQGAVPGTVNDEDVSALRELVPYVGVVVAMVAGTAAAFSDIHTLEDPELIALAVVIAAMVVRQGITISDHLTLLRLLHEREADARRRALTDDLTGLRNRRGFAEAAAEALAEGSEDLAVVLVDLDRFKTVNDELGHEAGDDVLVATAARLRSCLRPDDVVARLGGDEFAVLVRHLQEVALADLPRRLHTSLDAPVLTRRGRWVQVSASFGIAEASRSCGAGPDVEDLLRAADAEMYRWKRRLSSAEDTGHEPPVVQEAALP